MNRKNKNLIDYVTKVAIFSALSAILYFFPKFPLPFLFPSFLDVQFSNLPAILGGFVLGPIGGVLIVIVKTVIKLPFTSTAYVGELADLLIGVSTVIVSSLVYKKIKTKKGGIIALISGAITWVVVAVIVNATILIPFYIEMFFDGKIEPLIGMCKPVLPSINADNFILVYTLGATIPFNLMLSVIVSIVTFFVYKRVSVIFKKEFLHQKSKKKLLVISDSFKGTMSSYEIGMLVSSYYQKKNYISTFIPISDGGEGFLDSMEYILLNHKNPTISKNDIKKLTLKVHDASFNLVFATCLIDKTDDTLYVELAEASGIAKLKKEELMAMKASTYGTGELIKYAILNENIKRVVLGIGGSATSDMGSGMLEAMGVKFYDSNHNLLTSLANETLSKVDHIELDEFNDLIKDISFETLTDVINPLLGENGSISVFAPQKGATSKMLPLMEENFKKFLKVLNNTFKKELEEFEGSGAAGGVGFTMKHLFNSKIDSGIQKILRMIDFSSLVKEYDVVITGEGSYDAQSLGGKVISGIKEYKPKQLIIICGKSDIEDGTVYKIVPNVATIEESLNKPKESLEKLLETIKL